jgi:hypothetical protein
MKDEYDFSNTERGKFYRPDATLIPPKDHGPDASTIVPAQAPATGPRDLK